MEQQNKDIMAEQEKKIEEMMAKGKKQPKVAKKQGAKFDSANHYMHKQTSNQEW